MDFETLIQQPEARRDAAWEAQFLDGLIPRRVQVESPDPSPGPDGWPYLRIRAGAGGEEPFARVIEWLSRRGIGLVVNAHKMMPDYVFTYGMIWNFVETGRFVRPDLNLTKGEVQFNETTLAGPPTARYLPGYVRDILREFLNAQGFAKPRILVLSTPDYAQVDLAFSTESLNNLATDQHATMAEALHWFLPQHYSLVLASERSLPTFHAL